MANINRELYSLAPLVDPNVVPLSLCYFVVKKINANNTNKKRVVRKDYSCFNNIKNRNFKFQLVVCIVLRLVNHLFLRD